MNKVLTQKEYEKNPKRTYKKKYKIKLATEKLLRLII